MAELNFFDTYTLAAIMDEIVPKKSFFKDRYFPTGAGDIFSTDKVVTEYRQGDRRMAAFVAPRAGDIPVDRRGYIAREYEAPYIAPSRVLSIDDLRKRGFGEALYSNTTPAERAVRIYREDLTDLDRRITLREEWMCAQTMINNACTAQTYIDAATEGPEFEVSFYHESATEHTYTVTTKWDADSADIRGDVKAMCRMLSARGLPATDLVIGTDVAEVLLKDETIRQMLETTSNIALGAINETLTGYDGVVNMGVLNFGGFRLNVICVDETYVSDDDTTENFFPATSAMVTAPGAGHMMYAAVTQIDYGATEFVTHTGIRIPKFSLNQESDIRKLRVASRPLAAPKNYCPWIYAAEVVG